MPPQVKICGLSTLETLNAALEAGASYIGLVFFAKSPRNVSIERAAMLAAHAQGRAKVVGLFVDPSAAFVNQVCGRVPLDVIQLHGEEPPLFAAALKLTSQKQIWKAVPIRTKADLKLADTYKSAADLILYDAKPPKGTALPGGNGLRFDWDVLRGHKPPLPWALSGGLDARNIAEAVRMTSARLLDVSSGVESAPGVKDIEKIKAFVRAAGAL